MDGVIVCHESHHHPITLSTDKHEINEGLGNQNQINMQVIKITNVRSACYVVNNLLKSN